MKQKTKLQKKSLVTIPKLDFIIIIVAIIISITNIHIQLVSTVCVYNSECGKNSRCRGGVCVKDECLVTTDCLGKGLYFRCENSRCVTSKHKICRSDADCKKNFLHKKCIKNNCS